MGEYQKIKLNDGGWIPTVAFGTGTSYFNRVDDVCEGLVKAVKTGYRWIDTAVMYGTEVGVGKGLVKVIEEGLCKREELFITTKKLFTFSTSTTRILVVCVAICQQQEQEFSHSFYSEKNMASINAKVFILVAWCSMLGWNLSANAVT